MKNIFVLFSIVLIASCATGGTQPNDADAQKAAFALGTTPNNVTITNRRTEMGKVLFNASHNGRVFQCYYTSTIGITSDAICSPTDGGAKPAGSCNDLLKAAGKC